MRALKLAQLFLRFSVVLLITRLEPPCVKISLGGMLCLPGTHPFAPHLKAGSLHVAPHDFNHFLLFKAKLHLNGTKRCAIFSCLFNDPVDRCCI